MVQVPGYSHVLAGHCLAVSLLAGNIYTAHKGLDKKRLIEAKVFILPLYGVADHWFIYGFTRFIPAPYGITHTAILYG
jgi:hypothetical protein